MFFGKFICNLFINHQKFSSKNGVVKYYSAIESNNVLRYTQNLELFPDLLNQY